MLDITGSVPFNSAMQVTLNENGTIQQDDSAHVTLSGPVTGPGMLTKSDAGELVLSGTNNYLGGTTVTGGTLQFLGAASMPGGNLSVGSDLAAFGAVEPVGTLLDGLTGAGSSTGAGGGLASSQSVPGDSPTNDSSGPQFGVSGVPEPGTAVLLLALAPVDCCGWRGGARPDYWASIRRTMR